MHVLSFSSRPFVLDVPGCPLSFTSTSSTMRVAAALGLILALAGETTLSSAAALRPRSGYITHEARTAPPPAWTLSHRLPSHTVLPLRIGLAQQNLHLLEAHLLAVSSPDSPQYGEHWTPAQVKDMFAPSMETVDAVLSWLAENGFKPERVRVSGNGGWVEVDAMAREVEELLGAEYSVYKHGPSGREHICKSS